MPTNPNGNRFKLTKTSIERLTPPAKRYALYWDTEVRGFGLRITASGIRSFILQIRINGQEKRITIDRYPELSPDVARKEAKKLIGVIAGGGDPVADKHRQKLKAIRLDMAFYDYIEVNDLKHSTIVDMERCLEETFKAWQKKPITKITRRMVEKRYLERVKESVSRANASFRYLRAVLNSAASRYRDADDRPVLPDNPVRVLSEARLWRKVPRRRTVLTPDDLKTWVPAVQSLGKVPDREPGKGRHKPKLRNGEVFADLLMFLAMTGCRKGEAFSLKKEDVDLEHGHVFLRDTKNRMDLDLPLTKSLRELLKRRIEASPSDSDYVFASPHDGRVVSNLRYAIGRLVTDHGIKFTPHDLRRLAATSLERLGIPSYTIKAILNHVTRSTDVTGGYVVVDDAMKLAALEKLERFILQHEKKDAEVIDIDTRRAG